MKKIAIILFIALLPSSTGHEIVQSISHLEAEIIESNPGYLNWDRELQDEVKGIYTGKYRYKK